MVESRTGGGLFQGYKMTTNAENPLGGAMHGLCSLCGARNPLEGTLWVPSWAVQ